MGDRMGRHQRPQHEETAMREIDDAGDAKDQRQPRGHEEKRGGVAQPIEQLKRQTVQTQTSPFVLRRSTYATQWVKSCALTRVVWKVLTRAASSA